MSLRAPFYSAFLVFLSLLFLTSSAGAWVETAVRSHEARVEVAPDGTALVRHELVLKVRGGPMKSLEIGGMGTAIEPLPDASVRRAVEGSASAWPLTVSSLEDGSVRLRIGAERGIRGGSYLFSFAYSIDLNELGFLKATEEGVLVTWVGPRLTTGVDSAKVTFAVPRGALEPRIFESDKDEGASVLLGELRRGAQVDEVELVRAHLAVGEPAIWRILISGEGLLQAPALASAENTGPRLQSAGAASGAAPWKGERRSQLVLSFLLAFFYAALVFIKAFLVRSAAATAEARVRPLLPGGPVLRSFVSLVAVAAAVFFGLTHRPGVAVGLGMLAACLSTYLLPTRIVKPRGPGTWEEVDLSSLGKRERLPGTWLEARSLFGSLLFSALTIVVLLVAYRLLPSSNYLALMTTVLSVLLVPVFFTGRTSDLPRGAIAQAEPWLRYASRAIEPSIAKVELWGRRAAASEKGKTDFDETRLRLVLGNAPAGLRALEVSLDEAAGACVLPCVVVRVLEDSPTMLRLPSDVPWQRGRSTEERVALLRPTAPTQAQLLRLLKSLLGALRGVQESKTSRRSSGGSAAVASNLVTPAAVPSA